MNTPPRHVVVAGGFEEIGSRQIRLFEEASRLGDLTVLMWSDASLERRTGKAPMYPEVERGYFLERIRYVQRVIRIEAPADLNVLPTLEDLKPHIWAVDAAEDRSAKKAFCRSHGLGYHVIRAEDLKGFPAQPDTPSKSLRRKVVVTGCYDWFHTGHVRFFEEVSEYGDLYVIVGNDKNVRELKGEGHPLFAEDERRYMVGSIRYVTKAIISTGMGWLDADPEIRRLKPDLYAVNEDGDKGGKRDYCQSLGIQYIVLQRTPAQGLPRRTSTNLRGF